MVLLALALSLAFLSAAQEQQAPPAEEQATGADLTEEVEVRLVQVPFLARTNKGDPVIDLEASEVIIKEGGDKMRVAFLERLAAAPEEREVPRIRMAVAAPGTAGTTVWATGSEPRNLIFLIDVENDAPLWRARARDAAVTFVNEELAPRARVAVFSYNGAIEQETSFSHDRAVVAAAITQAYDRIGRPHLDVQARMRGLIRELEGCVISNGTKNQQGDESCLRAVLLDYSDQRRPEAVDYLDALDGMLSFAAGLNARTTVIALSHGVPADVTAEAMEAAFAVFGNTEMLGRMQLEIGAGEGVRQQMDTLLEKALRLGVTLHFVDRNPPPSGAPGARPMRAAHEAAQADLEEMAATTGGVFVTAEDVGEGLGELMDLERGAYLLSYYADDWLPPGEFRKVRISTTRRKVKILHRRGHEVRPQPPPIGIGSLTLGTPLELEAVGRPGQFQPFILVFRPDELGHEIDGNEVKSKFTLNVSVEAEDGYPLVETYHVIDHVYLRRAWRRQEVEPAQINGWVELPPGRYRLVCRFHSLATERTAEIAKEIVVPSSS